MCCMNTCVSSQGSPDHQIYVSAQDRPARAQTALLRVWRPSEALQAVREGDLMWATRLTAFSRGGARDRYTAHAAAVPPWFAHERHPASEHAVLLALGMPSGGGMNMFVSVYDVCACLQAAGAEH
jgi:hypothetical protein